METSIKILFLAAEAEPFIKIGGLADVAGTLPLALRNLSIEPEGEKKLDVRLVLPLHRSTRIDKWKLKHLYTVSIRRDDELLAAQVYTYQHKGMPVYFIESDLISEASSVYSNDTALDRDKYTFFSVAIIEMLRQLKWQPDILHANDWHTALALYSLRSHRNGDFSKVHSVLTLHNLPYMGGDGADVLDRYHLNKTFKDNLPTWGNTQPLPLGLVSADFIIPVSPGYAQEILTPEYGCGLEDYFRSRMDSIKGILNGLDQSTFNPTTDQNLVERFDLASLDKRIRNKLALQTLLNLPKDPTAVVFGMVGRINQQKGIDIALRALDTLDIQQWQLVLLGSGDTELEASARILQEKYPDRARSVFRYDESLGRLIYGGSDMFLMPSRYEPCGLAQMIAMRYGCVPVVRSTGGLKDTVKEGKTGFLFQEVTPEAMQDAIRRAISMYRDKSKWQVIQRNCMMEDFSWTSSARRYRSIYKQLING